MNIDQALISLCRKHDLTALSVGVTTPSDDRAPWFTTYAHYTLNGERGCASGSEPTAAEAIAHPMRSAMPILPMTDEQRRFWRLRRERAQQKDRRP